MHVLMLRLRTAVKTWMHSVHRRVVRLAWVLVILAVAAWVFELRG